MSQGSECELDVRVGCELNGNMSSGVGKYYTEKKETLVLFDP